MSIPTSSFRMLRYFHNIWLAIRGIPLIPSEVEYLKACQIKENDIREVFEYRGVILKTEIPELQCYLKHIWESRKFRYWIDKMDFDQIYFKSYSITCAPDFAGPVRSDTLLFFKGIAEVYDKVLDGERILSNVGVNRGASTSCLVIATIIETGRKYVALTEQMRWMTGGRRTEIVAGMKNEETEELEGPIVKELFEEMGIKLVKDDARMKIIGNPIWTSPGLLDEMVDLWCLEIEISRDEEREMRENMYGLEKEGENIRIRFYDYDTFDETLNEIGDCKAECCWRRHRYSLTKENRKHLQFSSPDENLLSDTCS